MRFTNIALTLATAGSLVAAQPHHHQHRHVEKRSPQDVVQVAGPTVVAFKLGGSTISQDEACKGIQDGSLNWAKGTANPPECPNAAPPVQNKAEQAPAVSTSSSSSTTAATLTSAALSPSADVQEDYQEPVSTIAASTTTASSSTSYSQPSQSSSSSNGGSSSSGGSSGAVSEGTYGGQGLESEFPDGQYECHDFSPLMNHGAIEVPWLNLTGWIGVQYIDGVSGGEVQGMSTAKNPNNSSDFVACIPGAMCSYACPPGYQKSQWPSSQGSTGQSVGGLQCSSDNKLHLTNTELSSNLCIQGTGNVNVQNKLSSGKNVAICRTDYPGTESETVPLDTSSGSTYPLTVPDSSTYYQHLIASSTSATTAQYYVNMEGVPVQEACQWSTNGTNIGNFAPTYFGVGTDESGKTWLGLSSTNQQNAADYQPLGYTIEIVGDNLGGKCRYKNGQYCAGDDYSSCSQGCTVELMSGTATYVMS